MIFIEIKGCFWPCQQDPSELVLHDRRTKLTGTVGTFKKIPEGVCWQARQGAHTCIVHVQYAVENSRLRPLLATVGTPERLDTRGGITWSYFGWGTHPAIPSIWSKQDAFDEMIMTASGCVSVAGWWLASRAVSCSTHSLFHDYFVCTDATGTTGRFRCANACLSPPLISEQACCVHLA